MPLQYVVLVEGTTDIDYLKAAINTIRTELSCDLLSLGDGSQISIRTPMKPGGFRGGIPELERLAGDLMPFAIRLEAVGPMCFVLDHDKEGRHVRCMFNEAVAQDLIVQNPFARLKTKPKKIERNWHCVDRSQFTSILERCQLTAWRSFLALQRIGALRRSEALAVTWPMIDWKRRILRLPEHITKTARERIVPLDPELHDVLKQAFDAAADQSGPIVGGGLGNRDGSGLRRSFQALLKGMKIEPWEHTFQTLRRNAVQDLRAKLKDPWAVTCIAGHSEEVERTFYLGQVRDEDISRLTGEGVDADLERVNEAWPRLKAAQRKAIVGVLDQAEAKRKKPRTGTKTGTKRRKQASEAA